MTDVDIWKAHFDKYGIEYDEKKSIPNSLDPFKDSISLETNEGLGYACFTFCVIFNNDGSFRSYGVWG
jgi:hypothetical protein